MLDFVTNLFKSAFDFQVLLTGHVWQQSSYQDNGRTQSSDTNVVSLEDTAQLDSGDDQDDQVYLV